MSMVPSVTPKKKTESIKKPGQNIQVFVRVRPLNQNELGQAYGGRSVVETPKIRGGKIGTEIHLCQPQKKTYTYDRVFGTDSKQGDVFKAVAGPLIKEVLDGYNCTVFAYGQTGTGKTYTMEGNTASNIPIEKDPDAGIIPRALNALFDALNATEATEWSVRVSFLELYNEEIFDLLSGSDDHSKLRLYEDNTKKGKLIVQGLEEVRVHDKQDVYRILAQGSEKRKTAETKMNATSSRSHTVFTVEVFINQKSIDGDDFLKIGKLNLVDLAGSENVGKSGAQNQRLREAGDINKSLLTLGRVINALVDRAPHIPYRESKLTRLLKDSLGGHTKTSIIATVGPAQMNIEETISTLDYAKSAKKILNKPEANLKISKKEKLLEYHTQIDELKRELDAARNKDGVFLPKEKYDEQLRAKEVADNIIREKTLQLKALEEDLEKFNQIFEETKRDLEETTAQRDKAQRNLESTRVVLQKTALERNEQEYLKSRHIDTEGKLREEAERTQYVADEATKDNLELHNKLDRKNLVEQTNEKTLGDFRHQHSENHEEFVNSITEHVQVQNNFCGQIRSNVDAATERRTQERSEITTKYADTVSNLIENLGNIERLTSDHVNDERSWVDHLLKRVRNEADQATQDFHHYLMEQLLTVTTKIMTSLQKQDQSVQELSSKMDKNFAGLTEKLDSYIGEQNQFRQKKSQVEQAFFSGLQSRNSNLESIFDQDKEATEQYLKSSTIMNQQIMELLNKKMAEEEKFKAARNTSIKNAKSLTSATAEASTSVQKELDSANKNIYNSETQFKDGNEEIMMKMKTEKAQTLEDINIAGKDAAKATNDLRTDAEAFTQKAKDQWTDNYKRTEVALREKSDKSSSHLSALQTLTGSAQQKIQSSQSTTEETIETWRQADEKATREAHDMVSDQCAELTEFGTKLRDQIRASDQAVSMFVEKQFKRDVRTGQTPARRNDLQFPNEFVQPTPEELRKKRFRAQFATRDIVANLGFENSNDDDLVENDAVFSEGSLNDTGESEGSRNTSAQLSRQNSDSGNLVKNSNSKNNSRTDLSVASSADTGIVGDIDNKENFDNKQFPRPSARPSKLRQPTKASSVSSPFSRSRSGSRTRKQIGSAQD